MRQGDAVAMFVEGLKLGWLMLAQLADEWMGVVASVASCRSCAPRIGACWLRLQAAGATSPPTSSEASE